MKPLMNEKIHGFSVVRIRETPEIGATVYELLHERTGARLAWLDREDRNMTFAISFATLPTDDTGVFHILEHSVLCGSESYPLRDPFAELLKGSLNTFLNAMTYEDRTVYPVSSGCGRDFMNLVDVYLDAVFRPNLRINPAIFRQEGWHHEYDGSQLTRTGVVYNEMKGAYSSPDEAGFAALTKQLFSGTCYGYDSGGDPDAIPSLTYESFLDRYNKCYHPSNALLVLDGSVDLDATLALIDSHLSRFERREYSTIYDKCHREKRPLKQIYYETSDGDEGEPRARLLLGYVFSETTNKAESLSANILCDYLAGSNAAPLKRALLDAGLCRDLGMYVSRAYEQTLVIELRDMDADAIEPAAKLVERTLREIIRDGIDKSRLSATVSNVEFTTRERDYGTLPKGVAFALSAFGVWHYGVAPEDALLYGEVIDSIKESIDTDYFERLLERMTVDCEATAAVAMLPDPDLSEKRAKAEESALAELLSEMSAEALERLVEEDNALKEWQSTEESEEARASLPTLSISDVDPDYTPTPDRRYSVDGAKALSMDIKTDGIIYTNLLLDASDLCEEELTYLGLLSRMLKELPTRNSTPLELQSRINRTLGMLTFRVMTTEKNGVAKPYLSATASALESNKAELTDILAEILLETDFSDVAAIVEICKQEKSAIEDDIISAGHSAAIARIEAFSTSGGAVTEYTQGYEAYRVVSALVREGDMAELSKKLSDMLRRLAKRNRMTVTIAGEVNEGFVADTVARFPEGEDYASRIIEPMGAHREFIKIPSKVAYAAMGARIPEAKGKHGLLRVARSILSYEHLWNTVRVGGGAYGAGFVSRKNAYCAFYSYRDPSPKRSLSCFADSADYLRRLADSGADITKFVIGAYGEYDVITTPKTLSAIAVAGYLTDWTEEKERALRADILSATSEQLREAADIIDAMKETGSVCIVGGAEHLESFDVDFERVLAL